MLKIENLTKAYGDKLAISQISFEVPEQTTFGLLGPNGAGKTTLIRIVNQILMADEGRVFFNSERMQAKHIEHIGYMPEERGLYKKMKVGEQLLYLAQLKGMSKNDAKQAILYWFGRLGMENWWGTKVESLSKGMQQKVQFIATVIHRPKLVILDEPFSGFDPVNAEIIKNELIRMRDEEGATIMLSTHRMESVEELCSHIAMIHLSELKLKGRIQDIKEQFKVGSFLITCQTPLELSNFERLGQWQSLTSTTFPKYELKPNPGILSNEILQNLMQITNIQSFNEKLPTVEEIFVKIAKQTHNE